MTALDEIVAFCDETTRRHEVADFPGANNGLQLQNNGSVSRIGAAVDAGRIPFEAAIAEGIDFLIVHHGLFWNTPSSYSGPLYEKLKLAMDNNLAVYSSHLPLDAHQEIGNNRLLAKTIGLEPVEWFLPYEGTPIALLAEGPPDRDELRKRLESEYPGGITAIEYGSTKPGKVAILTGSGRSALSELKSVGTDTLITGELRQEHFNLAQEEGFNLYVCGHYATERYGVTALAKLAGEAFKLPFSFVQTDCPL
ncbi:MAG: Nif3-like dinuclear metal center hexameric protein [Puniceicoccaceae bacterium]